jgi:hypothetical protein
MMMRWARPLLAVVAALATLALGVPGAHAAGALLYTQRPCAPVYAAPSRGATLITQLLGGTDVLDVGASASGWRHVRIWSATDGYVPPGWLDGAPPNPAREGVCTYPGVPETFAESRASLPGPFSLSATGTTSGPVQLYAKADPVSAKAGMIDAGKPVRVSAWAQGPSGQAWYQVSAGDQRGWAWAASFRLDAPDPATRQVNGAPIWAPMAGKGLWFTNYLPHHSDVDAMMRDAKHAGITHVYAEVATSKLGFYGKNSLDRLLPAAHAQGIKVITWVYPYLHNVSDDVRLTVEAATYRTPTGEHADGITADMEETVDSASVYTYGQLTRQILGPDTLMVATVFHSLARPSYPYVAVAVSWNVIAPMDYWHSHSGRVYGRAAVERFVTTSITTIRAALAAGGVTNQPAIEEIGQVWNMFTDDGTVGGASSPSYDEVLGDLDTARSLGCIGVSLYEWQTASQDQWSALVGYPWPVS